MVCPVSINHNRRIWTNDKSTVFSRNYVPDVCLIDPTYMCMAQLDQPSAFELTN